MWLEHGINWVSQRWVGSTRVRFRNGVPDTRVQDLTAFCVTSIPILYLYLYLYLRQSLTKVTFRQYLTRPSGTNCATEPPARDVDMLVVQDGATGPAGDRGPRQRPIWDQLRYAAPPARRRRVGGRHRGSAGDRAPLT